MKILFYEITSLHFIPLAITKRQLYCKPTLYTLDTRGTLDTREKITFWGL
jgi:hypothetical protein